MRVTLEMAPYEAGDQYLVKARLDFLLEWLQADFHLPEGPKWTLRHKGEIVGLGGFRPLGEGAWSGWAFMAELRPRLWLAAAWAGRAALKGLQETQVVTRIYAAPAPTPQARNVLRWLGFSPDPEDAAWYVMEPA